MTKQMIIEKANEFEGDYMNTDGIWCTCTNPVDFQSYLESLGFEIESCKATYNSSAKAITKCGILIYYNGYVRKI